MPSGSMRCYNLERECVFLRSWRPFWKAGNREGLHPSHLTRGRVQYIPTSLVPRLLEYNQGKLAPGQFKAH